MTRALPFIGRKKELAALEAEYERGGSFVVLYGRRRVGKTALIKRFIEGKRALYFLCSLEDSAVNLRRFAQQAATFINSPLLASASFDDWRPVFRAIADALGSEPYVLAIDELPYLIASDRSFPSVLQYVWDEILSRTNVTLVLCGSSVHMMHDQVLSHESPLYGRRTSQLQLTPLRFTEVREAFPKATYEESVTSYAITGGVPKYLEFLQPGTVTRDSLDANVFSTSGFLYEEPEFLLGEETRGTASHLSILSAVAQGNRKLSEISRFLGRDAQSLSPYVKSLVTLGYLERRTPFNERYPERSKNGLYYVSDSFLLFWLTYVQPFRSELEMGNAQPSHEAMARTFATKFVPFQFERICTQRLGELCAAGAIDLTPGRIGGYWNRTGSVELDVCTHDASRAVTFLGECKYYERKPVGMPEYAKLQEKSRLVPREKCNTPTPPATATRLTSLNSAKTNHAEKGADILANGLVLGLFSHTGFTDELVDLARKSDGRLVLIDKGEPMGSPKS